MKRGLGSEDYIRGDRPVEIECKIIRRTANGILIKTLDEQEIWLPSVFVDDGNVDDDEAMITIPEWLAFDRGLI